MPGVELFESALPTPLFDALHRAVAAIGDERIQKNYTTTFWYPRDAAPSILPEQCIVALMEFADPGDECTGIEWWVGRLRHGEKLRLHFDRDMTIRNATRRFVHPIKASALYLNAFPSSPMVVLDQVPSPDGRSKIPERGATRQTIEAVPNRYAVFRGDLRHGVLPREGQAPSAAEPGTPAFRLSLLVNYWHRRPQPPVCYDYDGSIYPSLMPMFTG